jgi:hypothetical protein
MCGIRKCSRYREYVTGWNVRISNPVSGKGFFFSPKVQNGSGAHPASYVIGIGYFPEGKAAGAYC